MRLIKVYIHVVFGKDIVQILLFYWFHHEYTWNIKCMDILVADRFTIQYEFFRMPHYGTYTTTVR